MFIANNESYFIQMAMGGSQHPYYPGMKPRRRDFNSRGCSCYDVRPCMTHTQVSLQTKRTCLPSSSPYESSYPSFY